jgi:hypothetical protein
MNKNRKRINNSDAIVDGTFSGNLSPENDNVYDIGTPQKRVKNGFFGNLVGTLTSFATIALSAVSNQITFGTTKTTTLSAVQPASSQTITLPDSGTSNSQIILQDNSSQQNIKSNLQVANNVLFTPTSTFITNGLFQINPDSNSKSMLQLLGWGNCIVFYEITNQNDRTGSQ